MRKFQYMVTLNLDDKNLEQEFQDRQIDLMDDFVDVPQDEFISVFASRLPGPLEELLKDGLGDAGESTVSVTYEGEVK